MKWFLFSIRCISTTQNKWDKKPVLFFVDITGKRHTRILSDYNAYVLVQPNSDSIEAMDIEQCVMEGEGSYNRSVTSVEETILTPLVGFTNNRKDRLFKVHYSKLGDRYSIMRTLTSELDVTILHKSFSNEMLLLHITNFRLQKWYNVDNVHASNIIHIKRNNLQLDLIDASLPPLSYVFLRLTVKSSTATSSNVFLPDHNIQNDKIESCDFKLCHLGDSHCENYSLVSQDEKGLIHKIREWFIQHDPCVLVHISDPIDHLSYLYFRAKQLGVQSGLSLYGCTENMNVQDNTFRDLSCPGRETMDILHILQKFMITPNLDGYTLSDAYDHPKLIRDKASIDFDRDVDVTLCSTELRRSYSQSELGVMFAIEKDNSFIINNMALSASCDLSLFQIISRGQQTRAFSCFARAYHETGIYINHEQFDMPYLLVKKPRSESSFPDPPWIENPPIQSLIRDAITTAVVPGPPRKKRKTVAGILGKILKTAAPTTKKRFGGGFVINPDPGLFTDPRHAVVTLDFASLYPSIMRGYKRCFMSVCYDERWLTDDRVEKEYVPLDDNTCCVFIKSYDNRPIRTVTDDIVYEVMKNRAEVRTRMKSVTDPFMLQSMDAQQLCCKVLQNAFYGACGSETFGIPCTAIAASICVIGQWMNKTVRYRGMLRGGRCVYGDTDSVMFQLPTDRELTTRDDILRDIYKQARSLEKETTTLFPAPNAVEFETLKLPHLQTKMKKTYGAIEYPPGPNGWKEKGKILIKGFAIKKRDRCNFIQKIGKDLISILFSGSKQDKEIRTWFYQTVCDTFTCSPDENNIADFIITCKLNTEYKQENVLALELADQYEKESGSRPRPGCRLRYVIADFKYEDRKLYQRAVTPTAFLKNRMELDAAYYLGKQLLLPIKQVLDLKPILFQHLKKDIELLITKFRVRAKQIKL
jgi:DNA polymerase elongation subunit (family B)